MVSASRRVQTLLTKLPADINPVNLEELRKVKSALVELETRADAYRYGRMWRVCEGQGEEGCG
jgi:hypothetical protein